MMKNFLFLILLLCAGCWTVSAREKTKIACVGNSITFGAGIPNREKNSYPAQLQYYLGDDYEVRNFGVSGTTALFDGDYPYVATDAFRQALAYAPDVVLIKLGTNDTKPQNWKDAQAFRKDYQSLIDSFLNLSGRPRIILLTPVRCYLPRESDISALRIEREVRPTVESLAYDNGLEIINLFNLFDTRWDASLMPDRLHPSAIGAGMMARKMGQYLLRTADPGKQKKSLSLPSGGQADFHGYREYHFELDGVPCRVVRPHVEAKGRPWVLRARFWGHEPQVDIALLEHGFHIAYCDVSDLYGSDEAVDRWNRFYAYMTRAGFGKKVVLEGMSRGGLIIYNWAAENPEKVACIYADAPVMDLKSWPMGEGTSEGSLEDEKKMLEAYGFTDRNQALRWQGNPLNHAERIAEAGIPILHVVGDADRVVPVAENTALFEKRMKELGASITVYHKPGCDHHPHSLSNPEPIVRFILKATGQGQNVCTHAVPGSEYRSGAGWQEGAEWHRISQDLEETLEGKRLEVLFLGNSIMQGLGGNRKLVTYKPGKEAMDRLLGEGIWETAGISGDRTQNLLWRIRYGNYHRCQPRIVVIGIGINNLLSGQDQPEETAEGIKAVVREARKEFPKSRILLLGLLPSGRYAGDPIRQKVNRIHEILAEHRWGKVEYVNPSSWFQTADGELDSRLYLSDYIHLTSQGYEVLGEHLKALMDRKR